MSLRTRIKGFTAWVNLRLTPYDQLLNNVLMDLLSGTHMKYFIESFTGREIKKLENMDGLTQHQKQTRVDWVMDELKKCNVIPDDVLIDSRLFAMRSADHVFDLLWRLISHDIWFVWERLEYLQHHDMDVLTQVPFKWTPEPPPKKKKSKKQSKKSLLSGFGASSSGADDTPEDAAKEGNEPEVVKSVTNQSSSSFDIWEDWGKSCLSFSDEDRSQRPKSDFSRYTCPTPIERLESRNSVHMHPEQARSRTGYSREHLERPVLKAPQLERTDTSLSGWAGPLESDMLTYLPPAYSGVSVYTIPLESKLSSYASRLPRTSSRVSHSSSTSFSRLPSRSSSRNSCSSCRSQSSPDRDPKLVERRNSSTSDTRLESRNSRPSLRSRAVRSRDRSQESSTSGHKMQDSLSLLVGDSNECGCDICELCVLRKSLTVSPVNSDCEDQGSTDTELAYSEHADVAADTADDGVADHDSLKEAGTSDVDRLQDNLEETWIKFPNAEYMKNFKKKKRDKSDYPSPDECILEMINYQLKTTRDGKNLFCYSIDDFVDSRVLCALVNSFVPNTFTADLLLNDRWTINLALKTAEKMFYAETPFDSEDLVEADPMAVSAYFAFFLMVAYRFRQTQAIVNRVDFVNQLIRECNHELDKFPAIISNMGELQRRKEVKQQLDQHRQKLESLNQRFDVEFSKRWIQHVEHVQNELRREIREKMRVRFDIVEIPRNITINDFCLAAVINLSLTNGSGFYLTTMKENLTEGRRLVLRHRETGEYIEDFTNKSKASVRQTLGLPEVTTNVVEVNPMNHPEYDFFFESQSRNKQLKTGTLFLYQVFPGATTTWQRLFIKSAREAEYETVEKMIMFFKEHPTFINSREPKSGNTALHWACRNGHFEVVRLLLENGANIDLRNSFRCTPLNLAVEGLQRKICHLLIEWGCDVHLKNIKGQSIFETIKNDEFKKYLIDIYDHYSEVVPRIMGGDMAMLNKVIQDHITGAREFCCLRSRCINGSTLLHTACYYGHTSAIRELLSLRVDVNLRDYKGATPLHRAKNPDVMQLLLESGGQVNAEDAEGNTPLHVKCYGETLMASELACIEMLLNKNASLILRNSRGLLPIHCCAMQGRIDVMKMMIHFDKHDKMQTCLNQEDSKKPPSLLHLAIANDFTDCAFWLLENNFHFKNGEQDTLLRRVLTEQVKLTKQGDAVKFLLENGADSNPKYPGGNTALHYAAGLSGPTDALELLLSYHAEVDAINEDGCTPLFFATQSNNKFAACWLLDHGANVRHRSLQGLTAFDHIVDFEEWIDCGYFTEDIKARLKAYNLKHARDLIRAISKKVKPPGPLQLRQEVSRSAFAVKGPSTGFLSKIGGSAGPTRLPPIGTAESSGYLMWS